MRFRRRLGFHWHIFYLIVLAIKRETFLRPHPLENADKLLRTYVPLVVLQPLGTETSKFILEPTAHNIQTNSPMTDIIGGGNHIGNHSWMPQTGVNSGNNIQPLGNCRQSNSSCYRFKLLVCPVASKEACLCQGIVKPCRLRSQS